MKLTFTFLLLFSFCQFTYSQSPDQTISNFFEAYKAMDATKAIDILYSKSVDVNETREAMRIQLKRLLRNSGKYFGADLLSKKTAGPNVVMYTYLVRHYIEPVTFRILLYKPAEFWQLQSFKINTDVSTELEEASKAYRSKENIRDDSAPE